jgi:cell cycle arrest protein BUB3
MLVREGGSAAGVAFGDGLSCVRFVGAADTRLLAAACWDGSVSLVDAARREVLARRQHGGAALACCAAGADGGAVASGGADGAVLVGDLRQGGAADEVGRHGAAVSKLSFEGSTGLVVSGGLDQCVKYWDVRARRAAAETRVAGKVFALDACGGRVLVACAGRALLLFDSRSLSRPLAQPEPPLDYQTRCVRFFPDASGFAVGCIAGRVAVESLGLGGAGAAAAPSLSLSGGDGAPKGRFSFKCHRGEDGRIWPVNALAFHPVWSSLATGGGDATVSVWDPRGQRRVSAAQSYSNSVAALDFSPDGRILAVAVSYCFEEGDLAARFGRDELVLREVHEADVKPRPKAA